MGQLGRMESPVTELRFPQQRGWIRMALRVLADAAYQRRVWIRGELPPHGEWVGTLADQIDWLYDACQVLPDPASAVGDSVHASEVAAFRELEEVFGPLVAELQGAPDNVYATDPRWPAVVRAAQGVLDVWVADPSAHSRDPL